MLQTGYTPLKGFTTWVKIYKMEVPLKIETERLILSPLKESDITLITEYLQEKLFLIILLIYLIHIPNPMPEPG